MLGSSASTYSYYLTSNPARWPKLLAHRFNIERQNLLLLNTSAPSSSVASVSIVTNQSMKLNQFSEFLDSLSCSDCDEEWNLTLFNGIELLLRAVHGIKVSSPSRHKLLLKLYKFKLKLLLLRIPIDFLELEECFKHCVNINGANSIDSFEEYLGVHPELDALLSEKLLEYSVGFSLKDKVKLCLDYKRRGGKEKLCKELTSEIFKDLKTIKENELRIDTITLFLDLVLADSEQFSDQITLIYQSNRKAFLESSQIFDKFMEILRNYSKQEEVSSAHMSSLVTLLNSKIRSFLGRPEAKSEGIVQSCVKFVLEFQHLNIGCIAQFSDFLIKCQLVKLEDCAVYVRKLLYKLVNNVPSSVTLSFIGNLKTNELKYEFVNEMLSNISSKGSCNSHLISIFSDFSDEKYIQVLEKYFKLFVDSEIFAEPDQFEFDLIDLFDDDDYSETTVTLLVPDENLLTFLNGILLPVYMKTFRSFVKNSESEIFVDKLPKLISVMSYFLLNASKITWTDLSPTFGPTAAASTNKWNVRSVYCCIYTTFIKLIRNSGSSMHSILKNVLNPVIAAEYWTRCLLDLKDYGQVGYFNLYYGSLFTNRLECFKIINAPAKFTFELLLRTVDFQSPISSDWWNYLLLLGGLLIENDPNLKGVICALFRKYIPFNDFDLIMNLYKMIWRGIEKCTLEDFKNNRKDLLLKHCEMSGDISRIINFIKSGDYPISIFVAIYYEFMNGFMRNEQIGFMIRLALITISRSIIKDPSYIILLSESLLRRNNTDFLGLYRNLVILMELKLIPDNVEILLSELCEQCELEYPDQFIKIFSKYQHNNEPDSVLFESLYLRPQIDFIVFKESTLMLSSKPTAFNCLSLLLKLLSVTIDSELKKELDLFIGHVRLKKGNEDEYFNLLFIE